jgi:hypothetical protein
MEGQAMTRIATFAAIVMVLPLLSSGAIIGKEAASGAPEWHMNASIIEACSCPMFCQCYFNQQPSGHAGHGGMGSADHFCKFNNAIKVNKGHYGDTKLDGVLFWVAGDLGGDFSQGKMDWAVLTFDKASTPAQREAIKAITAKVYPVTWNSFTTDEGSMTWDEKTGVALLDGGKSAEVRLTRKVNANDTTKPTVMQNLKYWGTPRNDGFVMMPNEVEAYRKGPKAFEYKGTNGFFITFDISSKDVAAY